MALLSFKTLAFWVQNLLIITIFGLLEGHQKMITQIDYEYYKSRGLFFLFGFYAFASGVHIVLKLDKENQIRKFHKEKAKSQKELRIYLENKNKKSDESI